MTELELVERLDRIESLLADARAELLDADQAAELLRVPASWVLAEARADRIPHVRFGRYVRFPRVELTDWWKARRLGPKP